MTAREFFYMVAEMRACQKAYFKSRDQLTLRAARKLENMIDKEIERVRLIINQDTPEPAAPPPPAAAPAPSTNDDEQ